MINSLALIEEEILLLFSLKSERLHRKAGLWFAEMRKPFALKNRNMLWWKVENEILVVICSLLLI